ncbi:molybdopterin-dependent oxidoreductase [Paraburkholderia sp. GAS42]|jgi:DMSO/TMAO reductase YedYZ molybdopterin-dependent catalytic subunit|uniref:molybdopterin-dependent oxidoreductase n=1 Tax=Paraburkholderia sp. GAS42 TaxID=3035135 RepID=UPI003D2152B8
MGTADTAAAFAANTTEGTISLTGDVLRPMSLSVEELKARANVLADPFDLRCFTTNRFIRTVDRYRGVLLRELINLAGLRCDSPGDFKRMVFIASAHDGYAVTFSWHELFNTPVGEQVLVAYECGGKPLDADHGAPVLFSGADILPAPRHVKRLARIETRVLRP